MKHICIYMYIYMYICIYIKFQNFYEMTKFLRKVHSRLLEHIVGKRCHIMVNRIVLASMCKAHGLNMTHSFEHVILLVCEGLRGYLRRSY